MGSPTAAKELEEGADVFQESVIRFHLAMTDAHMAAVAAAAAGGGGADPGALHAALRWVFEELGAMRAELYVGSGAAAADDGAGGGQGQEAQAQQREVQEEMLADCERKAGEVMLNLLRRATSAVAPDPEAAPGLFYECVRLRQEAKVGGWVGGRVAGQRVCRLSIGRTSIQSDPNPSRITTDPTKHMHAPCTPGRQHLRRLPPAPAPGNDGRGA